MEIAFSKYEATGNDFILIDDREMRRPFAPLFLRRLCHRQFGIGADGVIFLQPDEQADFRMRIFNSDGVEAEGCANGLRCLMRFLVELGLPEKPYQIAMGGRLTQAYYQGELIATHIGQALHPRLQQQIGPYVAHFVHTGAPHAVVFVPDVGQVDLLSEAPLLRYHPLTQPHGTNVNFATLESDGVIRIRTFERGVEGETLSCGTGAAAVAAMASLLYQRKSPHIIRFTGGDMEAFVDESLFVTLRGPAQKIFSGIIPL